MENTFQSLQDAAAVVAQKAPAVDPVVETPVVAANEPPATNSEPPAVVQNEAPKADPATLKTPADDFYARFAEKFGNPDIKDEESFTKWKEEASKPKEPEYPHALAKQQAEYLKGSKDEAEVRQRMIEFNFFTTTNWEEKTKSDEGMNELIRIGHQFDNPGMSQKALAFSLNDFLSKHSTDVEELREAGEQDPEGRAELNRYTLVQKAQATLEKIYAKRGSLADAVQKAADPVGEARKAFTESAKGHLGSFKVGSGDLEYAMAERDIAELSTEDSYNGFIKKLTDPAQVARLMAADKFLNGGGFDALLKKATDKGAGTVLSTISNTQAPSTANIPDGGSVVASSMREAGHLVAS